MRRVGRQRIEPLHGQMPAHARTIAQRDQRSLQFVPQPLRNQALAQRIQQLSRVLAVDEGLPRIGEHCDQIIGGGGIPCGIDRQRLRIGFGAHRRGDIVAQTRKTAAMREHAIDAVRIARAVGPQRGVIALAHQRPEQARPGARRGCVDQQARGVAQRQQCGQQRGGIVVVNALLVTFAIARRGEIAQRSRQQLGLFRLLPQQIETQPFGIALRSGQRLAQQILAAIQLRRFRLQRDLPEIAQRIEFGIAHRREEFGAGQMQAQAVAARQHGQVEFLGIDAEAMARAELDDVAAFLEQLAAIAQRAHRLVAHALEPRLHIVGLHAVLQAAQAFGQIAQFQDQRIAGEERVEFVHARDARGAAAQAFEDPRRGVGQRLALALAVVQQRLFMGLEGFQQFLALGDDIAEELLVFAELAFQFLQLHHQPRQFLIAAIRIARRGQRAGDALPEQRELRAELRDRLAAAERLAPLFGAGLGLVEPGVDLGNGFDDAGALGGVVHAQRRHQFRQHVQIRRQHLHLLLRFLQRRDAGGLLRQRIHRLHAFHVRMQHLVAGQEFAGGGAGARVGVQQFRFHRVDRIDIDVAILADGQQAAALRGDRVQRIDAILHALPVVRMQATEQRALAFGRVAHRLGRLPADAFDLLVFVQHRFAAGDDLAQQRRQPCAVPILDPVVLIEEPARGLGQQLITLRTGVGAVDAAREAQQFGNAADQIGIADPAHEGIAGRLAHGVIVERERRLPDLHRMDACGLVALRGEDHHAPVFEARVTVADHRRLHAALDHVVDEHRDPPVERLIEQVQHVLAVGRTDGALEAHALHCLIEGAGFAVLQHVAAGKHDAVVFRQLHAGLADRIDPMHPARQRVVDQMPPFAFAIGQYAQQDQTAETREIDLRIVERLGLIVDGLAVDAQSVFGVVLDLDGEIAAGRFHEHGVEDVEMRMTAVDRQLAGGAGPLEVVRRRQRDVALAAIVDVAHGAAGIDLPAEHADVLDAFADLERRQQLAVAHHQLQQSRILVVGLELVELLDEIRVAEKARGRIHRGDVVAFRAFDQPIQREDVLDPRLLFQADEHVVAEQQAIADLDDVARDAVVLGADAQAADHFHPAAAEFLQPLRVQRIGDVAQLLALIGQPATQDFIGAAFGNGLVHQLFGGAAGIRGLRLGWGVLRHRSLSC